MTDESTPKLLRWRGAKIYRCRLCAFDSTDKKKFEHHFAIAHPPLRIIDGGKDETQKPGEPDKGKEK